MTDNEQWHLGAPGDLRELPPPSPGIPIKQVRYGGIHQAVTGARTVDVTGFRGEVTLKWDLLERADWEYLEALHLRAIPGPLTLLVPGRVNRLSPQATTLTIANPGSGGLTINEHVWDRVNDSPPDIEGTSCISLTATTGEHNWASVNFDMYRRPPAINDDDVDVLSVWIRDALEGGSNATVNLGQMIYDTDGKPKSGGSDKMKLTGKWQRFWYGSLARDNSATMLNYLETIGDGPMDIRFAAPQYEDEEPIKPFEHGGGAMLVSVDQLDTTRQLGAYTDVTLTLVEV